jgi:hypothetical protein
MNLLRTTTAAAAIVAIAALSVQAQMPPTSPAQSATAEASARPGMVGTPAERMAMMDSQMKSMREMHDKMMQARTPAERAALKAEHMKSMHEGMAMMGRMGPGGMKGMQGMGHMAEGTPTPADMAMRQQMMEKHMEMMHSTMQMMMDQMPPAVKQ